MKRCVCVIIKLAHFNVIRWFNIDHCIGKISPKPHKFLMAKFLAGCGVIPPSTSETPHSSYEINCTGVITPQVHFCSPLQTKNSVQAEAQHP